MPRITLSDSGGTPFQRLLGHNPAILDHWNRLEQDFFTKTSLDADMLEQIRRALAQDIGCSYCQARGAPEPEKWDEATRLAATFVRKMARAPGEVTDEDVANLRDALTERQIAELTAYGSFVHASHAFALVLGLEGEDARLGVLCPT